ncbi:MAG: hypothetical protein V9G10_18445 [Candidatus Nanopelagicales bacterium]
MIKRLLAIGTSAAMGVALLVGVSAPAPAATVKACVKKKSGEVRILTKKKKCKAGWKKISWNQKGATGNPGPQGNQGPAPVVKDGNGNVLGKLLGLYPAGITILFVEINGGIFLYTSNGQVLPLASQSADFLNNTCTGTPVLQASSTETERLFTQSAGGPARVTYRQMTPALGVIRSWAFTTTAQSVNQQLYKWDSSNNCVPDGAVYNGRVVVLQEVAAPQDVPGPLTIG